MHRHLPPLPAVQGPPLAYPRPAAAAGQENDASQEAAARARRIEAEALGTGLDDAGQPPAALPLGVAAACLGVEGGVNAVVSVPDGAADTGQSRTAQPSTTQPRTGHTAPLGKIHKTHPTQIPAPAPVQQARLLRRQLEIREHSNGPQYNPHRDDRRPTAHQADSGNDWHQAS